jgi:hypothetical protein
MLLYIILLYTKSVRFLKPFALKAFGQLNFFILGSLGLFEQRKFFFCFFTESEMVDDV